MASILSILPLFFVSFIYKEKGWFEKELFNSSNFLKVSLSIALSLICVVLFHQIWNNLSQTSHYGILIFQLQEFNNLILLILNLTFFCVIEELLFRGFFQEEIKKMSQKLPSTLSIFYQIMIPAILFSLMHIFEMGPSCLIILIPGIIFGCLKYYSSNLYAAIGSHLIFNFYYFSLVSPRPF